MWTKRAVKVPELEAPNYNPSHEQCVIAGELIFIAGQTGWRNGIISSEFDEQVRQAFANIEAALRAAGAGFSDIVSMTVFLTDVRFQPEFSKIRRAILGGSLTASATIGVNQLFDPRAMIEIQVTAVSQIKRESTSRANEQGILP
jgi:2-iminobutanoate/2-iminopropanoate deaminase